MVNENSTLCMSDLIQYIGRLCGGETPLDRKEEGRSNNCCKCPSSKKAIGLCLR